MIRIADINDIQAIYALICELEETELNYDIFSNIFASQLSDSNYTHLLYYDNEKVCAVLNMRYEYQLHHAERIAEILEFVVDKNEQNSGIGSELFSYACQIAKEEGCSQIELSCNQKRTDAHKFYKKNGMLNSHYRFTKRL